MFLNVSSWIQVFERENDKMYEDLVSLKDSIQQIESKVVRIAELQEIFTEKVTWQLKMIPTLLKISDYLGRYFG